MVTISQIRKIHTLKSAIGLDDDLYRDMLMSFGVQSSKDLTYAEAIIFLEILEEKAVALNRWKKLPKKYSDLNRSDNMATDAQLRMIEGMWREICYFDNDYFGTTFVVRNLFYNTPARRKFLKSKFKVDDVMFLTKAKATKVIQAIKGIKNNLKKCAATQNVEEKKRRRKQ